MRQNYGELLKYMDTHLNEVLKREDADEWGNIRSIIESYKMKQIKYISLTQKIKRLKLNEAD